MSSLYSFDLMMKLSDWFEEDGFTPEMVNLLGQKGRLRMVKMFVEGDADIVPKPKFVSLPAPYLRLVSKGWKLTLPARDGTRAIARAGFLFTGHLDLNFVNYGLDVCGVPTPDTAVELYELVRDGRFEDIYNSVGVDLEKLVLTQDQILSFVVVYSDMFTENEYEKFFLMRGLTEFFVVNVTIIRGYFGVSVWPLSFDVTWRAGNRLHFVLPQLTPGT